MEPDLKTDALPSASPPSASASNEAEPSSSIAIDTTPTKDGTDPGVNATPLREGQEFYDQRGNGIASIVNYTAPPGKETVTMPDNEDAVNRFAKNLNKKGYTCRVHKDLDKAALVKEMESVAKHAKENKSDAILVAVLCYVKDHHLQATDKMFTLEELSETFIGNDFARTPKMFFIDTYEEHANRVEPDCPTAAEREGEMEKIPERADFFFAFSAPPRYYGRGLPSRSYFIKYLNEVLEKTDKIEIWDLMEEVTDLVCEEIEGRPSANYQVPTYLTTFRLGLEFTNVPMGAEGQGN